ncbi:hypothetical protein [Campylobacter sputorum]|uniref:hypothetical protein n=1 Tax=Campylobacter sputorum TaxID=206 RepID=UPI001E4F8868|nr:hypothetical protein [Campylobacter sputorum]
MIIIHARGNETIGIGNLSRCFELLKFLFDKYEVMAIFECSEELFTRYKHKNSVRSENLHNSLKIIQDIKPQIYICDLIDANKKLSDILRLEYGVKKIIHFNSIEFGFEPDILVVMDGFDYEIKKGNYEIYRGFEYYIISQDLLKYRKKDINLKSIKNVLISFGGADPANFSEYFANVINDDKYNYTIVLGPAMSENRKEAIAKIKKPNITYVNSPKNLINLLLQNDILVTLGGMSTYEAMMLGVPVCGVRWSYLAYCVENFAKLGMINDLFDINSAYDNLINLKIADVNEKCAYAYKLIDGSALKNIESIITKDKI